jgi:uncharacterized damage-inducible protein DinB
MLDHFRRLLDYDDWANREALHSLEPAPPARALKLMAHIVGAEWLWLARLHATAALMAVWPEFSLAECVTHQQQLRPAWREYLDAQTVASLQNPVEYKNSKGERWANTVQDIVMHVVLHSAYHRGQIAAEVRAHGSTPAYTDFIEAVRRGQLP